MLREIDLLYFFDKKKTNLLYNMFKVLFIEWILLKILGEKTSKISINIF